ncbi:MAG: M64 family metallopeptidase [Coprococcus sp.]
MVVVVCGEGYTKSQQGKFINDVKRLWQDAMKYEPYRSYADRFNVYALCTASESTFDNGGSTFFDVIVDKYNSPVISNNLHGSQWKNHIFERCIGPEFIEKIHDAHIKKKCDPNTIPSGSEYEPYYYVHDYIAQFAMVVNTKSDFGGAYNNREYGFHYFISPSDSYRASKTFAHEFGHGLLGLGDEYSNGYLLDDKELKSLNLSSVEDPEKIKWRQLLGFRNTYTCRNAYGSKMLVSSYECIMRDTNYQFCEVCRLQGFKRMSQLVKDVDLYVATPEVKEYTGAYSKPSDFTDLETSSYYNYTYNRNDRLLSGNSKSRFNTNMNGKKIELRTVIQNISDKNARQLKFKMWIKHSDGSVATDSSGNPLQTVQTFDIPVWNDKANFWPLGALDHIKSDFNSGLKSCSLIYQIPSDAQLKSGDTVAFQVLDENGNVLADDNTETQRYTTVSIQYKFEDGSEIPNTAGGTFTVPYGTKLDLTPAKTLYDYEFIKVDGLNKPIVSDGTVVTYYYKNKNEEHTHNLTLVAAKAATCTEGGKEAYYKCEGCGKFYEDVLGTKEITDLASWGNIAKIAHTTKQTVTKATPTANGKIVNYCSVCKKTLSTTVIPKASSIKLKATSLTYNGKVRTPKVIVKDRTGKTLVKNTDYTVSYAKGRKYVGKYAVKITFKGKYSGTKTLYFTIKPKATSISSLKAGSKKFTVKWKKQATQTTGYQVQYSASSKFSKAKTVTVGKNTTVSKKISKLSGKKKYYVRVRTYKTVKINGKSIRIYSGWSKAKTVTTKK